MSISYCLSRISEYIRSVSIDISYAGVPAGGQAGGFDGVGAPEAGILNHELGHALGLPHWANSQAYPYRGDMHGVVAPNTNEHVGPTWAFDLSTMTFLPPTCAVKDPTLSKCNPRAPAAGETPPAVVYKSSPMQGGGVGDQPVPFFFRHFSDYGVRQMQDFIENKLAVKVGGDWKSWNQQDGLYSKNVASGPMRHSIEETVVVSLMAACTLAGDGVSMVYPPIGPYTAGLIRLFDATDPTDRADAGSLYCPSGGCDFSLRVHQGNTVTVYILPASGESTDDPYKSWSLRTVAINLPDQGGIVTQVELLATPDVQTNGPPTEPEVLHAWPSPPPPGQVLPPPGSCGEYEAEDATASGPRFFSSRKARPFSGEGFMDFQGKSGEHLEWTVDAPSATNITMSWRYALARAGRRDLRLSVNGITLEDVAFPGSGSWSTWIQTSTRTVQIGAGSNTIRITSIGSSGGNVDQMQVCVPKSGRQPRLRPTPSPSPPPPSPSLPPTPTSSCSTGKCTYACAINNHEAQEAAAPGYYYPYANGGLSESNSTQPLSATWEPLLEAVPGCNGLGNGELLEVSFLVVLDASWVDHYKVHKSDFERQGYATLEDSPRLMFDRVSYLFEAQFGLRLTIGPTRIPPD